MPPLHDPGLSYEHFRPWFLGFVALSIAAGLIEGRALRAAGIVAIAQPVMYIPYALFGYADRNYSPLHLQWENIGNVETILAMLIYFLAGFLTAIVPAAIGTFLRRTILTRSSV